MTEITSEAQLRELLGEPLLRTAAKDRPTLHEYDKQWLARSPFCLVATCGADGSCDVSPKGDPAGFTLVLDDTTIAIPERPGNRRADGFRNILTNPHVGLIYLVPGRGDTLRINGRARLVREAPFFDRMVVKGHRPLLAVVVKIDQVFYHCSKAFLRSNLWQPASWDPEAVPSRAQITQRLERPDETLEDLQRYYGPAYSAGLYRDNFPETGRDLNRADPPSEHEGLVEDDGWITAVAVERRWMEYRMHQFQCGHQECFSQFSSPNKDDLMRQVADHLREVHNVEKATQTLLRYLESTCVTSRP